MGPRGAAAWRLTHSCCKFVMALSSTGIVPVSEFLDPTLCHHHVGRGGSETRDHCERETGGGAARLKLRGTATWRLTHSLYRLVMPLNSTGMLPVIAFPSKYLCHHHAERGGS